MDILIKVNTRIDGLRLYPQSDKAQSYLDSGGYGWLLDDSGKVFVPFTAEFWEEKPVGLRDVLDEAGLTYTFA